MAESLAIGLVASVIGIFVGLLDRVGPARAVQGLGIELGATALQLEPRTIIVGLLVGMIVTLVSGFVPARRATRDRADRGAA